MKKALIIGGLVGILLASLSPNIEAQKRQYVKGNVHDVKYEVTTEKNFPKYKIEEQCLFDNCYTFWNYAPKKNELNFWVSKKDEEAISFQEGEQEGVNAPEYIPEKIGNKINVTNLAIERTSYEKLKKRTKHNQDFGFSVNITDRDLKFKLPEIDVNGTEYIVLKEVIDNSDKQTDAPFYLIPKTKGTVIFFPNQSFTEENGFEIQAQIVCDEDGGVYQPILKSESGLLYSSKVVGYPSGIPEKENKLEKEVQTLQTQLSKNTQSEITEKQESNTYTIKPGDTFYNIADRFYGTGKDAYLLQKSNPDVDPSRLKVGQTIIIPKK